MHFLLQVPVHYLIWYSTHCQVTKVAEIEDEVRKLKEKDEEDSDEILFRRLHERLLEESVSDSGSFCIILMDYNS